ncbi:MAG: hypothetical protein L0Z07_01385, partial [Planctomycetes bacterium]|nr:hypothetical protein [Planctomycetota bacterium]
MSKQRPNCMWKRVVGKSPIARAAASSRGPIAALTLALFLGTSGSLLFVFAPWNAVAGTPAEGGYQSYPLRHVDVDEVRSHIAQLLANSATQAEIVVDAPRNAILIRGNEQVHRLVRELISEVDRPSTQPAGRRIDGEGQVRVYDFHGNDLERFMVDLRNRYAGRGDVRVSADGKSRQVVVLAPPQEHAGLERDMGTLLQAVASTPASGGAGLKNAQTGSDTPATRFIELHHLSIPQFENTLAGMFGTRLAKEGHQVAGGLRGYQLSITSGDRVTIGINDRFNQLSLQGSESLVAALARVIAILDRPGDPTGQAVQIVPLRRADPEKLREAFRAYRGDTTGLAAPRGNPGTGENRAETPAKDHGAQTHINPAVQAADFDPVDTGGDIQLASVLLQEDAGANAGGGTDGTANTNGAADEKAPEVVDAQQPADGGLDSETAKRLRGLRDNVEIEMLPELDVVILRGSDQDVRELVDIIQEIERISEQSVPR